MPLIFDNQSPEVLKPSEKPFDFSAALIPRTYPFRACYELCGYGKSCWMSRTGCPIDAGDEYRAFAAPYLTLMKEDAPQRSHDLREVFNGLRWLAHAPARSDA